MGSLETSGDGRLLCCGRGSGTVSIMKLEDQEWISEVTAHHGPSTSTVRGVAFDASSRLILTGGDDNHVCVIDAATMIRYHNMGEKRLPQLERFPAHTGWVTSVSVCPDPAQRMVVSTGWDSTVKIWDYGTSTLLGNFKEHSDSVFASAFSAGEGKF